MLLIGSLALSKNVPKLEITPKDSDFIVDESTFFEKRREALENKRIILADESYYFAYKNEKNEIIELTLIKKEDSNYDLLKENNAFGSDVKIASNETLLWLKESHKYKKDSPNFYKTMEDIHTLRLLVGDDYKSTKPTWFDKRVFETYNYNHPSLNTSKEEFFDDSVPYIYDHDHIHEYVAIGNYPAYKDFLDGEVNCSKDLFKALDYEKRLNSVVEESMVLALERSLIPNNFDTNPVRFFLYALMKVSTSITSGWWREFAWENHIQAINKFKKLRKEGFIYEDIMKLAIEKKEVKLHNQKKESIYE